jgi:hypothetical protein
VIPWWVWGATLLILGAAALSKRDAPAARIAEWLRIVFHREPEDDTRLVRLRGPNGEVVQYVEYVDKAGHRRRVLRLTRRGYHVGDFPSVEALADHIDVGSLIEDDDQDPDS